MTDDFVIFDDDLKDEMRSAQRLAERLKRELSRARQAGLDISELEMRLNETIATLKRIGQVYGVTTGTGSARRESRQS